MWSESWESSSLSNIFTRFFVDLTFFIGESLSSIDDAFLRFGKYEKFLRFNARIVLGRVMDDLASRNLEVIIKALINIVRTGSPETHGTVASTELSDFFTEFSLGAMDWVGEDFSKRGFEKNALNDQRRKVISIIKKVENELHLRYGSLRHYSFRLSASVAISTTYNIVSGHC